MSGTAPENFALTMAPAGLLVVVINMQSMHFDFRWSGCLALQPHCQC